MCGAHLPADAAEAAAPQSPVDARLPDPRQVITVEEEVVPFFPALGGGEGGYELLYQKLERGFQSNLSSSSKLKEDGAVRRAKS